MLSVDVKGLEPSYSLLAKQGTSQLAHTPNYSNMSMNYSKKTKAGILLPAFESNKTVS